MKKRIRRGDPQKQTYWEEVVRRWREGGQSVRAFCRAEGVRESAFYFWRRELARRGHRDAAGDGSRPEVRPGDASLAVVQAGFAAARSRRLRFCPCMWWNPQRRRQQPRGVEIVLAARPHGAGAAGLRPADAGRRAGRAGGAAVLSLSELVRIYVCLAPTDMRKSFDSLAAVVRD